jgi:hypothetical protein
MKGGKELKIAEVFSSSKSKLEYFYCEQWLHKNKPIGNKESPCTLARRILTDIISPIYNTLTESEAHLISKGAYLDLKLSIFTKYLDSSRDPVPLRLISIRNPNIITCREKSA